LNRINGHGLHGNATIEKEYFTIYWDKAAFELPAVFADVSGVILYFLAFE